MSRKLGVAISGGGHRATLWGLGVLLYLVDAHMNRRVTTITSVSGGSIANGYVGRQVNFRSQTDGDGFRKSIKPLLDHITKDGLFFYGSATNRFLAITLGALALGLSGLLLAVGIMVARVGRYLLDLVGVVDDNPLRAITLWPVGLSLTVVFGALLVGTRLYSKVWNPWMTTVGGLGLAAGIGLFVWGVMDSSVRWSRLEAVLLAGALAVVALGYAGWKFGRRSRVAQAGMEKEYLGTGGLAQMDHGPDGTLHVICATEMQSGIHAFFTGSFIYSYQFGVSRKPAEMRLAQAVQASAALPGAFGPRKIDTRSLGFERARDPKTDPMLLFDGGVYDNMADQWFMGLKQRRERFGKTGAPSLPGVDDVVVANASTGWEWKPFGRMMQNGLMREGSALLRIFSVFYNTVGRRRRSHLIDKWKLDNTVGGTLVEVNDNPSRRGREEFADRLAEIEPRDLTVVTPEGETLTGWEALTHQSQYYPTVLRRIENPTANQIMWHAYLLTALAADRYLDEPIKPEELPSFDEFVSKLG